MKALIVNLILSRGVSKLSELGGKVIRHGLGIAGGWLLAQEYATTEQMLNLEGGALALLAIVLSVVRTFAAKHA